MEQSPGSMTSNNSPGATCSDLLRPYFNRKAHDSFAMGAHFVSLGFIINGLVKFPSVAMWGLFAMQSVSFLFHCFYVSLYLTRNERQTEFPYGLVFPQNQLKWREYGLSATAGAFAVIYANASPSAGYLALLIIMSLVQQYCGAVIDKFLQDVLDGKKPNANFLFNSLLITFASFLQIGEFIIVSLIGNPPFAVFISYVVGWSFFGIHCVIHASVVEQITIRNRDTGQQGTRTQSLITEFFIRRYSNRNWVEAVYSCLGWAAKIAVFSTEYLYLKHDRTDTDELNDVAIGFGTFALFTTFLTVSLPPARLVAMEEFL